MGKYAIMSRTTNEAVIIDEDSASKDVAQDSTSVIITEAGNTTVYYDCYLVKIS